MHPYHAIIERIALQTKTRFGPASEAALDHLRSLNLPQTVIDFYSRHEPQGCAEGQIRLWGVDHIREENADLMPGADVAPLGYVVFATTFCGDTYCFNTNRQRDGEPEIVLISHEVVTEDISPDEAARVAKPVAANLLDFLNQFADGQIDEECVY